MKLKLYIFASLLLIIATSVYVFINFGDTIVVHKIYTLELAMPTYIWIIVPMIILFFASLFHMIFYGLKLKFEISRWHKDALNLKDSFNALLLGKNKKYNIKHTELDDIAQVLSVSSIEIKNDISHLEQNLLFENLKTNKTIISGGYVKLSKSAHNQDAALIIQNYLNRLDVEADFAKQVVKNKENYAQVIIDKAINLYVKTIEAKELKSLVNLLNKKAMNEVIQRIQNGTLLIDEEMVEPLFNRCDASQYITFTKAVKTQLPPDSTLNTFKSLFEKDLNAKESYIYLLVEFEMLEQARELLIEEAEFENFKAYLDLREVGKKYPLDMFI